MFMIDEKEGIIAAGPVVQINSGLLGHNCVRAVLRVHSKGIRFMTNIQRLDDNGNHVDYDPVAIGKSDQYDDIMNAFFAVMKDVNKLGFGYHD